MTSFGVGVAWTRMLDAEANGRSQWVFSLRVRSFRPGETTARSMVIIWTLTREEMVEMVLVLLF